MEKEVMTRIAEKYQVTVPPEFRDLYDLRVGDLFHWRYDEGSQEIRLIPKRAQLLSPQVRSFVGERRAAWEQKRAAQKQETTVGVKQEEEAEV